ncbi:MAG: DUF1080 domain-containing protein [Lentisphaeraceae bacterium]|nr:DUF1080 domain-containing protein [Lentisphaeraceae bacterium]
MIEKAIHSLSLLFCILLTSCSTKSDSDWIPLFDGKDLTGWSSMVDGEVKAENGEITILTTKNLWLLNEKVFTDFELEVEALMPSDSYNSGIGFRLNKTTKSKPTGYQCEVAGSITGSIFAIGSGWVYPEKKKEGQFDNFHAKTKGAFKNNEWNKIRIVCKGPRIQIWLNGVQTADVIDGKFSQGSIALQHHGKGGVHRFRNIRIKSL